MKRVTLVGFVGLGCLVAACGGTAGPREESTGHVSSALVDKTVLIGDLAPSHANRVERLGNVAAGAGMYAVAWGWVNGSEGGAKVTRLTSTGEILDPQGILFPDVNGESWDTQTSIDFDGTNFRVTNEGWPIFSARLSPQGEWLDPEPPLLYIDSPFVCMDDGNCYGMQTRFWEDPVVRRFVRIDPNNEVVDVPGTPELPELDRQNWVISSERLVRAGQSVAHVTLGTQSVGETEQSTKIWVEFFDSATGGVTAPLEIASTRLGSLPTLAVAAAGREGEALFVWSQQTLDDAGHASCSTLVRRIGSDGKALEAARTIALPAADCGYVDSLFYTGSGYVLATNDHDRPPSFHRLSAEGELANGTLSMGRDEKSTFVGVASTGDTMLLATGPADLDYPDDVRVYARPFENSGEDLGVARPIAAGKSSLSEPAVAWNGESYFVVWADDRNGLDRGDLFGARVAPNGTQLDATALPLLTALDYRQETPAIAWSGQGYLLVTHARPLGFATFQVMATFIDAEGHAMPAHVLSTDADAFAAPAVAWNGKHYLAAWVDGDQKLHVSRFDGAGQPIDDDLSLGAIAFHYDNGWSPAVAATPDGFFVAWRQQNPKDKDAETEEQITRERDIYGVWLDDSAGAIVKATEPKSLTGGPFSVELAAYQNLGAACSPDVCWVAWNDGASDTKLARFDHEGKALGPLGSLATSLARPLLAWDGHAFLVSNAGSPVVAGYLTESGQPFTPTLPSATTEEVAGAAIATDGDGHGLIVTSSKEKERRLTGIFVSEDAAPEPNGGSGGQPPEGGGPGTVTAGSGGTTSGGQPNPTEGGAPDETGGGAPSEAGGSPETNGGASAGSAGSSAGAPDEPPTSPKTDKGCGCSVAGGDTSRSPWLLLGLLSLVVRRRRAR